MSITHEIQSGNRLTCLPGSGNNETSGISDSSPSDRIPLSTPFVGAYVLQRGLFRTVNFPAAAMLGYDDPVEVAGRSFRAFVHPDDRGRVALYTTCTEADRSPEQTTFRVMRKDGGTIWVCMQGRIGRFEGKPANIGTILDISAMVKMKGALEKYRSIINEVEDAVAEADLSGNITFTNDAGCRIFGHTHREAIGRNYREYMDDDTARYVRKAYKKVYETGIAGKNIVYEIIRRSDGQRRIVEDSVCLVLDEHESPRGFRTVCRDITGRRKTEVRLAESRMRLSAIFESVQDAIITVDLNLNVIEANHAAKSICGLDPELLRGRHFFESQHHCSQACQDVLRQTLGKKTAVKDYRIECALAQRPDQKASVSSSPLQDDHGQFLGAVLVIRDITLLNTLKMQLCERQQYHHIIGRSEKMKDLFGLLEKLADMDTTVLVTGESGTGKELVARALHHGSPRAFKPFVTVNCSALAESLLESELFGHVKGSFTGAFRDNSGRFQAAGSGTILLDEVGDISPFIQLKLLRVLQDREYERVGESIARKMNARVIACTNTDLKEKVRNGEFREDLYYRLKVMELALPPLRERMEDIPLLSGHFCAIFNERFGKNIEGVSDNALLRFMNYPWPGNIRELEHAIEHAFVLCTKKAIDTEHLPPEIRYYRPASRAGTAVPDENTDSRDTAAAILNALNQSFWNKSKAAGLLGISRPTLYKKMQKYRIRR